MNNIFDDNIKNAISNSGYTFENYINIINSLNDEKSKIMAYYRLMYDNTKNPIYIINLLITVFKDKVITDDKSKILLDYLNFLLLNDNYNKKFNIIGYNANNDNYNKWQLLDILFFKNKNDIDLYTYKEEEIDLVKFKKYTKIIFNLTYNKEELYIINDPKLKHMKKSLISKGIREENIFVFEETVPLLIEDPYFDEDMYRLSENDIFLDGGAYYLETSINLLEKHKHVKKIYAIEPIKKIYNEDIEIINKSNYNIEMFNNGLWSKQEILEFNDEDAGDSRISINGKTKINCNSIDNILNGKEVSIIKLDIEGAEYEALLGAEKTIKTFSPILYVCIYHNENDLFKLFNVINSMNIEYNYYIRHYSLYDLETVLICVPKSRIIK